MRNSYQYIRQGFQKVPTSLAVQDGNYKYTNPVTNKPVTASDIYARDYLHLSYIFWGTEQPYFSRRRHPL